MTDPPNPDHDSLVLRLNQLDGLARDLFKLSTTSAQFNLSSQVIQLIHLIRAQVIK